MMDHVQKILQQSLQKKGLQPKAHASSAIDQITNWVMQECPHIADAVSVTTIKNSEVTVVVSHSIAAQELQSRLPELQDFIASLSSVTVETIRILRK